MVPQKLCHIPTASAGTSYKHPHLFMNQGGKRLTVPLFQNLSAVLNHILFITQVHDMILTILSWNQMQDSTYSGLRDYGCYSTPEIQGPLSIL